MSEEKKPTVGQAFENELKDFLKDTLQFDDVDGGPSFHIAATGESNQIDACGRYKNTLFVFECKASGKRCRKDMREDILKTATKARMAFENYRNLPQYKDCSNFRFIFITKRIDVPDTNKKLCMDHSMFYEDSNLLEYYAELTTKIRDYAIYNFLADFNISPPANESFEVNALKTKMGGYTVYNFYALPKDLLKFSYVARRRNGREDFYQRMLDTTRIKKIQKFLDNGGSFPTNIVLSLRQNTDGGKITFKKLSSDNKASEIGILSAKNSYNAFWVIDGQHRLYSFAHSSNQDTPISCIAIEKVSIEKERGYFLEINREQRPIQADLIWDLEGLSDSSSSRGIISNVVHTLNKNESGPFFHKIYIPLYGSKEGKIVNMAAFCNGIQNSSITKITPPNMMGMINPLTRGEPWTITKRIADVISRYFTLLDDKLGDKHKDFVFGNAGIPIMLYVFEPILAHVKRIPSFNDLNKYVDGIVSFFENQYETNNDLKKLKAETNSEGARKGLARQIGITIRKEIGDKIFWPEMEQDELSESIIFMERRLAEIVASRLKDITTNWHKQKVPESINKKCIERMALDGTTFEENLSLGDISEIIVRKDNWDSIFQALFVGKNKFENVEELKLAFKYLSKVRNPYAHGKSVFHTKDTLDQCELHLRRLDRMLPKYIISTD